MNSWKTYGAHAIGALLVVLPILEKVAPTAIPGYGAVIAAGAGGAILFIHAMQTAMASNSASLPAPSASAVVKLHVLTVILAAVMAASVLAGCATAPNAKEEGGIVAAVDVATGLAISEAGKITDPAVLKARAVNFKVIAAQVQAVNDAGTATIATLAADLQPQIAKLSPADQLAARALVSALTPYLQSQIPGSPNVQNLQTTVDLILTNVILACGAYGT